MCMDCVTMPDIAGGSGLPATLLPPSGVLGGCRVLVNSPKIKREIHSRYLYVRLVICTSPVHNLPVGCSAFHCTLYIAFTLHVTNTALNSNNVKNQFILYLNKTNKIKCQNS